VKAIIYELTDGLLMRVADEGIQIARRVLNAATSARIDPAVRARLGSIYNLAGGLTMRVADEGIRVGRHQNKAKNKGKT
jgi:hypothetical protein